MQTMSTLRNTILFSLVGLLAGCADPAPGKPALARDPGSGRVKESAYDGPQPDFSTLKSPLTARVVDRRFRTREAMYLANETEIGGDPFLMKMVELGMPISKDRDFQYITAIESYWYSRYNMSAVFTESRLGVHLVHGPYVSEKALEEGISADNRDRGERIVSNKTELIQRIIPAYLTRTGFPRRFEDASPCMLQFASGDPFYPSRIDKGTEFRSVDDQRRTSELRELYDPSLPEPASGMGKPGNDLWKYRINYRENFVTLRWDHDKMEHEVDLGAEGQTLVKLVLWCEYFFRAHHHGGKYLGNNPEEGFRGAMLNLGAVSKMLILKAAMLTDGKRLVGVNPLEYDPDKQMLYFPHRIGVRLRYIGDMPPRPEEFTLVDASSRLFDQASLLWGLSEYYHLADPTVPDSWDAVFGEHPPYDGSLMEQKYALLAHGLANIVLLSMERLHRTSGGWVSRWTPTEGLGSAVSTEDIGVSMIALANCHRRMRVDEDIVARSEGMLRELAEMVVGELLADDGHVADGFDRVSMSKVQPGAATLLSQAFAVRGLLEAYKELGDEKYLLAARRVYGYMNQRLWNSDIGVYCTTEGCQRSVYTPLNLGATLGAMREMILQTRDMDEVARFKRFWVQAVDSSGIQQSEYEETGERDFDLADGDGDGIRRMEFAGGRHGIAPVFASKVEIEMGSVPSVAAKSEVE